MNSKAVFNVYYDSLTEADWFSSLNPAFDIDDNNYQVIEFGRRKQYGTARNQT